MNHREFLKDKRTPFEMLKGVPDFSALPQPVWAPSDPPTFVAKVGAADSQWSNGIPLSGLTYYTVKPSVRADSTWTINNTVPGILGYVEGEDGIGMNPQIIVDASKTPTDAYDTSDDAPSSTHRHRCF